MTNDPNHWTAHERALAGPRPTPVEGLSPREAATESLVWREAAKFVARLAEMVESGSPEGKPGARLRQAEAHFKAKASELARLAESAK